MDQSEKDAAFFDMVVDGTTNLFLTCQEIHPVLVALKPKLEQSDTKDDAVVFQDLSEIEGNENALVDVVNSVRQNMRWSAFVCGALAETQSEN